MLTFGQKGLEMTVNISTKNRQHWLWRLPGVYSFCAYLCSSLHPLVSLCVTYPKISLNLTPTPILLSMVAYS